MTKAFESKKEITEYASYTYVSQGFWLTFPNDLQISVQFGTGNYCDQGSTTAEVAIINTATGKWYLYDSDTHIITELQEGTEVHSHVTVEELVDIMFAVKNLILPLSEPK
jgi:hypothetical protein